jgi:hypothetical protein
MRFTTRIRPPPFVATRDFGQKRFGMAGAEVYGVGCPRSRRWPQDAHPVSFRGGPEGIEELGMEGPSVTLGSPWPPLAIRQWRFAIAGVRLRVWECDAFCHRYGGNAAVVDTKEKLDAVYKLTQKTNEELEISRNYIIGLESKLMLETN